MAKTLEEMTLKCDPKLGGCGHLIAMAAMLKWYQTASGGMFECPGVKLADDDVDHTGNRCGRSWSYDEVEVVIERARPNPWPGFPLKKPIIPNGRRKNGAAPGMSFPVPVGQVGEPTRDEIERVRRFFASRLDTGDDCPCCTRYAKRQHRVLGCGPARWLIELVYLYKDDPIHTGQVIKNLKGANVSGSDATSVLPLYGLISPAPAPSRKSIPPSERSKAPKGRTSGYWRPTQLGRDFVFEKINVPERVVTCLGLPEAFEGIPVSIREALGKKFNYAELMRRG